MIGEGDRAVRAALHPAALPALDEAGVAPPVQEEDHLLALLQPGPGRLHERRGEDGTSPRGGLGLPGTIGAGASPALRGRVGPILSACGRAAVISRQASTHLPQVHHPHRREAAAPHPLRELHELELALPGVGPALQGGCGAAEDAHRTAERGPDNGQIPGVIAGRLGLLVAAVVLLVHHDRPQIRQRGEEGRAGAHGDPLLAGPELTPGVVALAVREAGVEDGYLVPEAGPEAGHGLGREGDLGHQDHRPPSPPAHHLLQEFDVDERLPRPGHPVEEEGGRILRVGGRHQALQDAALGLGRREVRGRGRGPVGEGVPEHLLLLHGDDPLLLEASDHRPAELPLSAEVGELRAPAPCFQELVGLPLAVRPGEELVPIAQVGEPAHDPDHLPGLRGGLPGRDGLVAQDPPFLEPADLGPERAHPQLPGQGPDPLGPLPGGETL